MDEDDVWTLVLEHGLHFFNDRSGDKSKRLPGAHDGEIVIGFDFENIQNLVKHFSVLPGYAHAHVYGWIMR